MTIDYKTKTFTGIAAFDCQQRKWPYVWENKQRKQKTIWKKNSFFYKN